MVTPLRKYFLERMYVFCVFVVTGNDWRDIGI